MVESIKPYNQEESKSNQIRRMFDAISAKYDIMNRVISLGCDKMWRRSAINKIKGYEHNNILDVATGTGDMAILLYNRLKPCKVTGCDISQGMLDVAMEKARKESLQQHITFVVGDGTSLPFNDNTFDVVTVSFGIRNFENLQQGLQEINRVLKRGGVISILELSKPPKGIAQLMYNIYSLKVIPMLGRMFTPDTSAYAYLGESIQAVPQGEAMIKLLENSGFTACEYSTYTFGVCSNYRGTTC